MCMLIAKFSSQAHELMLQFFLGNPSVCARCSLSRSRLSAPLTPASCRRARAKARVRSASARHAAVGCRCAPRPGAVPPGSGTTDQDSSWPCASGSATTRNNSRLAARRRQPMHVRTGPSGGVCVSSRETTGPHSTVAAPRFRTDRTRRPLGTALPTPPRRRVRPAERPAGRPAERRVPRRSGCRSASR